MTAKNTESSMTHPTALTIDTPAFRTLCAKYVDRQDAETRGALIAHINAALSAASLEAQQVEPVAIDLSTHEGRCKAVRDLGGPAMAYAVQHGKISLNDAARCSVAAPAATAAPIPDGPIDANALEQIAKDRPDECFLKGSGVLKLIGAIRELEVRNRTLASPAATAAPKVPEPYDLPIQIKGEPDESFYRCTVYVNGWNACREAMLAAAPTAPEATQPAAAEVGGIYDAALLAVERVRGYAATIIEDHSKDSYDGRLGCRPQDVAPFWAEQIHDIDAKAFLDEAIADQAASPAAPAPYQEAEGSGQDAKAIARNMMSLGFQSGHMVSEEAAEDMLKQFDAAMSTSPTSTGAAKADKGGAS